MISWAEPDTYTNKVIWGDCLKVMKRLPDNCVDLVIADIPYNIGKDSWDKVDNYYKWVMDAFLGIQRILKDNGSFYWFQNDMMAVSQIMRDMELNTDFIFKQFITWNKRYLLSSNKEYLDGYVAIGGLRNYQRFAEYILFYTFQDETGLSKIMGNCVYPIRDYIRSEITRAKGKINLKEINTILGTATNGGGVASAVLSEDKAVPAFITEEHYLNLRAWLNNGSIKYLRREYEDLRYTFNNQKTHHSVWEYDIAPKKGHITPKPVELIKNIIRHSSNPGDLILDPMCGSGTSAVAAYELGRSFIGIERELKYVGISRRRLDAVMSQGNLFRQTEGAE